MTCLHSEVDAFARLRAEAAWLGCDVEKMTASCIYMANMRDEAVERANNLSAQLAASVCWKDTYMSTLVVA